MVAAPRLTSEFVERELEALHAPVGRDRARRVGRAHQRRNAGGADALRLRLAGEGLLPALEAARAVSALGGVGSSGHSRRAGLRRWRS